MTINVHYFQHVPFEEMGSLEPWLKAKSARISTTKFFEEIILPDVKDIDWLIIMGGPMSVNDEQVYPWLRIEKEFIAKAIVQGRIVLGICLGAQLIASALGARVYPNQDREIGWFPIEIVARKEQTIFAGFFPSSIEVFHWHGETFDLPFQAIQIARSEACKNQAFSIGERILGLQFHIEVTSGSAKKLIENCSKDIVRPASFNRNLRWLLFQQNLIVPILLCIPFFIIFLITTA